MRRKRTKCKPLTFYRLAPCLSSRFRPGGLFKDYDLHEVAQLSTEVEELDAVTLNYWLSKFVMEVAKKSRERYPPRTIYGLIICNIQHMSGGKEGDVTNYHLFNKNVQLVKVIVLFIVLFKGSPYFVEHWTPK